ncbi:MAG: CBS domain-containing protein [Bacteroidetes bacterium]|nr:MAG: CBS domain-containing protein [Bacteroidota bacterium]
MNPTETAHFLSLYPPFDRMDAQECEELARTAQFLTFHEGDTIFRMGDSPLPYFFVVKTGLVQLIQQDGDTTYLNSECDEGDIFGLRAWLANHVYLSTAFAIENTEVFALSWDIFNQISQKNPKVALFLASTFASKVASIQAEAPDELQKVRNFLTQRKGFADQTLELDAWKVDYGKQVIDCTPHHTIREAAKIMSIFGIGSILVVDAQKRPVGIITDSDFRKKVVAVEQDFRNEPVTAIMSAPVKTIKPDLSVSEVILLMLSQRISHFCITQDGSDKSPAIGLVSQRDILIAQGNNPILITKQLINSTQTNRLHTLREQAELLIGAYLQRNFDIPFIANIVTEINNVLMQKATEIAKLNLDKAGKTAPDVRYCWAVLGAEGRREQLIRTDLDTILILEEKPEAYTPETKRYFQHFAMEVKRILKDCGFEESELGINADNPAWCKTVKEWEAFLQYNIDNVDESILNELSLLLDFRPTAGSFGLAHEIELFLVGYVKQDNERKFLRHMAQIALKTPPPMSFFRTFIVESSGVHKNKFDIKARALRPLADLARVLALEFQLHDYNSTFDRFHQVANLAPQLTEVCEASALAYEILLKKRALYGLRHKTSGRYISPDSLDRNDKQELRSIFKIIEKLQEAVEKHYGL